MPRSQKPLGEWVNNQRKQAKLFMAGKPGSKGMTQERIDLLNSIGFYWGKGVPEPPTWEERFKDIEERHSDFGVKPRDVATDTPLGKWIAVQRRQFKRFKKGKPSSLSSEQAKRLKSLGF